MMPLSKPLFQEWIVRPHVMHEASSTPDMQADIRDFITPYFFPLSSRPKNLYFIPFMPLLNIICHRSAREINIHFRKYCDFISHWCRALKLSPLSFAYYSAWRYTPTFSGAGLFALWRFSLIRMIRSGHARWSPIQRWSLGEGRLSRFTLRIYLGFLSYRAYFCFTIYWLLMITDISYWLLL